MVDPKAKRIASESRHLKIDGEHVWLSCVLFHINDQGIAQIEIRYEDGDSAVVEEFTGDKSDARHQMDRWMKEYLKRWKDDTFPTRQEVMNG